MAKDRAAPFSRKHRRYWIPVTGGMILIGVINVALGMCSYHPPEEPGRIELHVPVRDAAFRDAPGTLGPGELPAAVMRAFAERYPRTIPAGATIDGAGYLVDFPPGAAHRRAVFAADGTLLREE